MSKSEVEKRQNRHLQFLHSLYEMNLRYGYLKAPFIFANKYEIGRSLGFVDIETEQIVTYLKKENLITELTRNYYSSGSFVTGIAIIFSGRNGYKCAK